MSMKIPVPSRLAALLIAATMIGCGGTESNRARTSEQAQAPAPAVEPARGPSAQEMREAQPSAAAPGTVLFIGTSLTAGLGLPEAESFPLVIEQRIESAGLPFQVVNAGVSGETSAGALRRVDWLLRQDFDVAVIETGANDMLRGIDPATTEQNIQEIVNRLRAGNPDGVIVLAGMLALPNMGQAYAEAFESIYPRLAERNGLPFVPFLLDGVGGERDLNQSDGVHPNAEGHQIIADTVWRVLEPVLVEATRVGSERASLVDRER
jgi:acyl-CoA thioesterase I